ncbi:hypothetical protein MJO29_000761 [Puccinia striiformis f. sp. tritici]|uniref:Myb/SANT-like domain-containing protein n=1 Tax=Puccinia striiformis f. sp. tritici PST-78 TaxID=1165861 RepID=A0A0L0UVT6_9BASI|nr:hypothetical protein Pst134EA_000777 [Puccinia striiformis f. sp. tritici]KAH9473698.1 hypothetical protein Pst134EA_000777 [Puccinia striiformis f. sp. tritici]KAI7967484.1 hypothetical protein MJO29_000761 [Puccinia striiformis f. sp. tritici]KNE91036.1 hypothetical protein PSTG_15546 [Puccinia striiformis f. sp. tritici PST-78]
MPPKKAPTSTVPKTKKKKSILWDRDGVNGGPSSIEIILRWITTGKNYTKWRGDKEEGKSKVRLLTEINKLMNKCGIFHREAKGIRQKIGELQKSYNKARDFLKNTGEGILAEDEENGVYTVEQKIQEECPYWDQLDPIMGDRSVTQPLHVRSTIGGDQPGRLPSPEDNAIQEDPNNVIVEDHQPDKDDDSEGSQLPDIDLRFIESRAPATGAVPVPTPSTSVSAITSTSAPTKKKQPKKNLSAIRPATRSSARASRIKKMTTEDLYMKSIVSKRQSKVTRARAEASKVKVAFMKELREHGLTLAEIECKVNAEFPPLADMYHDKGDESTNESDDSL